MTRPMTTRRDFLKTTALVAGGLAAPHILVDASGIGKAYAKNDGLISAAIGVGGRGSHIGRELAGKSRMAACADVDRQYRDRFKGDDKIESFADYRKLLEIKTIDALTIGTPDHWHTKICIDALQAGKHVYCEKPLTLTIDEGKLLCRVVKETGKTLQVGTQQRTEMEHRFLKAVAIAQSGKLGKIKRVTAALGRAPNSGAFKVSEPPDHLDWNTWLGQAPEVPYTKERCHANFRWWYEYSGGQVTDAGAHHVDIAQWAIGKLDSGPRTVEAFDVKHPDNADENGYNTAREFRVHCLFADGVELVLHHEGGSGVRVEGEKGELFVSRAKLSGDIVDQIAKDPKEKEWLDGKVRELFAGRRPKGHMDNFLDAVADGDLPMSDVYTHHRILTTCHLANIAVRTGKKITWDAEKELAVDDDDINERWVKREQRMGFEIRP